MQNSLTRSIWLAVAVGGMIGLGACSVIPGAGPSSTGINGASSTQDNPRGIQIVDVTDAVAHRLYAERSSTDFASVMGGHSGAFQQQFGVGDAVQVSIWEAPPATLFGSGTAAETVSASTSAIAVAAAGAGAPSVARSSTLPEQIVDAHGDITVPFIGAVRAAGRTPAQLQSYIQSRLQGMAHDPQVLVQMTTNNTSYVTVVGDVANSTRMQLSARGERLLDALAAAGGAREPVDKTTVQVTRGNQVALMPLQAVIRDPRENIPLRASDVVTVLFQPYSFTALGATGKNDEINFEAQGITLAQALARSGGLQDTRADAQGVFIFRLEKPDALNWPDQPVRTTADGKVPVIYRVNLRDPNSFFVAQSFMMDNKDVLYVSNAPVTEIQKVLNLIFSVAYPIVNGVEAFN